MVHIVRDAVLAGLAYDMDELYESDDHNTYALVYSIRESSIEMGVMKVEEGMFEVLSTSENKSINVNVLHGDLVKYLKELYPELEDVATSIVSVLYRFRQQVINRHKVGQGDGKSQQSPLFRRHCTIHRRTSRCRTRISTNCYKRRHRKAQITHPVSINCFC